MGDQSGVSPQTDAALDRFQSAQAEIAAAEAAHRQAWEAARQQQLRGTSTSDLADAARRREAARVEMAEAAGGVRQAQSNEVNDALRERYGVDGPTTAQSWERRASLGGAMASSAVTELPGAVVANVRDLVTGIGDAASFVASRSLRDHLAAAGRFFGSKDQAEAEAQRRVAMRRELEADVRRQVRAVHDPRAAGHEAGTEVAGLVGGLVVGGAAGKAVGLATKGIGNAARWPWQGPTAGAGADAVGAAPRMASACATCTVPRAPKYSQTQSMSSSYRGEQFPGGVWPTGVRYLSESERQAYKLTVRKGRLYDARGKPFDTQHVRGATGSGDRMAIVVMDAEGNFYAATQHGVGHFHHSSFLAGKDVAFAGEIEVKRGVVRSINRRSGHYRPTDANLDQAVSELRQSGVDLTRVDINRGM